MKPVALVVVDDDVDRSYHIEGADKEPEERTHPRREEREHGKYTGCEIAVCGKCREVSRQVGAYDAWNEKNETEEAKTVQAGDGTLDVDPVHRLEPGPDIRSEEQ